MMKTLFLMQGVPGSGKSWMASVLQQTYTGTILSTDDYWYDNNGFYAWDPTRVGDAHHWNQQRCRELMQSNPWHRPVIIDNTNILREHAKPYIDMARAYGYEIQVIRVECPLEVAIARNLDRPKDRQVPPEVIIRMYAQMERLV
jgi:predicted kinase